MSTFLALYSSDVEASISDACNLGRGQVLAIARKSPRLIESYQRSHPSGAEQLSVFTERALPFMAKSEFHSDILPVFDDILVYGSTMKRIVEQVRSNGILGIPVVVAIDSKSLNPFFFKPWAVRSRIQLPASEVSFFNAELVKEIRKLGKPYDVDHPLLYFDYGAAGLAAKDFLAMLRKMGKVVDITQEGEAEQGIINVSLLDWKKDFTQSMFSDRATRLIRMDLTKIRVLINKHAGIACIEPIAILNPSTRLFGEVIFSSAHDRFNKIAALTKRRLLDVGNASVTESSPTFRIALSRTLLYLVETAYGWYFTREFCKVAGIAEEVPYKTMVDMKDVQLIFGPEFSKLIIAELTKAITEMRFPTKARIGLSKGYQSQRSLLVNDEDAKYYDLPIKSWTGFLGPESSPADNFSSIFACMYYCDELPRRREGDSNLERLNRGVSVDEIKNILRYYRINISDEQLSALVDICIDNGSIVPIYVERDGLIQRLYRFGENVMGSQEVKYAAMHSVEQLDKLYHIRFEEKDPGISEIQFEKFAVLLFDAVFGQSRKKFDNFNYRITYDRFGARLQVAEPGARVGAASEEIKWFYIRQWLFSAGIVTSRTGRIQPNLQFYTVRPREGSPLDSALVKDVDSFVGLFCDILWAKNYRKQMDALLALTTCSSHHEFLSALKEELRLWLFDSDSNYSKVLMSMNEIVKNPSQSIQDTVKTQVENAAGFLSETASKTEVWNGLQVMKTELEARYTIENPYSPSFSFFMLPRLQPQQVSELELLEQRIRFLSELTQKLTSATRSALGAQNPPLAKQSQVTAEDLSDLLLEINSLIDAAKGEKTMVNFLHQVDSGRVVIGGNVDLLAFIGEASKIYLEIERVFRDYLDHPPKPIAESSSPIVVAYYDWMKSTALSGKIDERMKITSEVNNFLERTKKELQDGMWESTTDDSNATPFASIENAVKTTVNFIDEQRTMRRNHRFALCWTKDLPPPFDKVVIDEEKKVVWTTAYNLAARMIAYVREKKLVNESRSWVVMTRSATNALKTLRPKWDVQDLGACKLRDCDEPVQLFLAQPVSLT